MGAPIFVTVVLRRSSAVAVLAAVLLTGGCDESSSTPTGADGTGPPAASGGATSASSATLSATRFLAFGDSMTHGEVTTPVGSAPGMSPMTVVPTAAFPAQLEARLRARYRSQSGAVAVANEGRSGELAVNALPRLAQLLANTQPQALLLLHGSNDLLDFGAGGVSPASAAMNLLAREGRSRGARVFIALLPPPIAGRQRSVPDGVVRAFNDQLRAIAAGEGALVVDLYAALSGDLGRYIGVDGHHPNEAGYQRIADEFLARISAELERR